MNQFIKTLVTWVLVLFALGLFWVNYTQNINTVTTISYSEFLDKVDSQEISSVEISGDEIQGKYKKDHTEFSLTAPQDDTLVKKLREKGVDIKAKAIEGKAWYIELISTLLPLILIVGFWIFLMRQMQSGAGKGMSFGKSKAKLLTESQVKVTFKDVAGIDEARAELEEIVEFLKNPKKFTRLGGRIPKGVLLIGRPGTGKTLLAKAIAGEAGVPFFTISGSDFVEMFVGVGASRVRDLFIQGKKSAPCIVFIDEIDAVGRHRGAGLGGGHDEREQTLNQLLVEMDGFESSDGLILIAATNRPDVLDPALMRPGRFDRRVVVPNPDLRGREGILKVHTAKSPLADDVDIRAIARGTPGFSGAELEMLVNEAALNAARANRDAVTKVDFEFARDKVTMGAERRSMILTEKEKELTAYHEAGHALVAKFMPYADPVHKLTIIPRGMALGFVEQMPETDRVSHSKNYLLDRLAIMYGGREAENLIYNDVTNGATSDIEQASRLARNMICNWGMSDVVGAVKYASTDTDNVFLGREIGKNKDHSEETQTVIDNEVKVLLDHAQLRARQILRDNIDKLHALAKAALEKETLDSDAINLAIGMEPVVNNVQ